MAFLIFCFSEKGRKNLNTTVKWTSLISTLLSILCFSTVLYSIISHSYMLHDLIISLFQAVYVNLLPLSILHLVLALAGFKINLNIKWQPTNHSISRCLQIWSLLVLLSMPGTLICLNIMSEVTELVESQVLIRYKHGVSLYMDNLSWQRSVYDIQQKLKCCGAHSYTDWYTDSWIPVSVLPPEPSLYAKLVQPNGRLSVPVVPSSCCRESNDSCGHLAWIDAAKNHSWAEVKPVDPSLIYTEGCAPAIISAVSTDMLLFRLELYFNIVLQIVTLVGLRYFYSSKINSLLLGQPAGKAPGWLFMNIFKPRQTLEEYYKICYDKHSNPELQKKKKKWKCLSKIQREPIKDTDSEGTPRKRRFKAPPCFDKFSEKCKRKKDVKPVVDSESKTESLKLDVHKNNLDEPEVRPVENYNVILKNTPFKKNVSKSALRESSNASSRNLRNEESITLLETSKNIQVFQSHQKPISPFVKVSPNNAKDTLAKVSLRNYSPPRKTEVSQIINQVEMQNEHDLPDGKVFQTRELFERATKLPLLRKSYDPNLNPTHGQVENQINLIDFEVPSEKVQNYNILTSQPPETPSFVLRNYRLPSDNFGDL